MMRRELIHPRTRNAFRDHCSDFGVVRQIERAFADEGFDPVEWTDAMGANGVRRGTFDQYTSRVDWTDPTDVRKVLNAFEQIMSWGDNPQLARHLKRDGYAVDSDGGIRPAVGAALVDLPLELVRDPGAIREHFDRITESVDRDPALAISGAKALIEATCKTVLEELVVPFDEKDDVPTLVKATLKTLKLDRDSIAPTATGAETVKRVLSNLSQVAIGIAELRNEYGPDHGRSRPVIGLAPRHAHLAVGAASTFCQMVLETVATRRTAEG